MGSCKAVLIKTSALISCTQKSKFLRDGPGNDLLVRGYKRGDLYP
jgi:hypothetical protein